MLSDILHIYSRHRYGREKERERDEERDGKRERGEGRETLKACQSLLIILIAELKLHAKA